MICLAAKSFNTDVVRRAFDRRNAAARQSWRTANPGASYTESPSYEWIKELWTDHLIVEAEHSSKAEGPLLYKYEYTVDSDGSVEFGDPVQVKSKYVVVNTDEMAGAELSDRQILDLAARLGPCGRGATDTLLQVSPRPTALDQVVAAAKRS